MKKILLIEDDNGIQTTIKYYLQTEGFIVETASKGIWDKNENYVNDNTLTVYIKRIREKNKKMNNPDIIKTIREVRV